MFQKTKQKEDEINMVKDIYVYYLYSLSDIERQMSLLFLLHFGFDGSQTLY